MLGVDGVRDRRSILVRNFSVKSRKGRNKEEGTTKKGDGIQTAELNRRVQVTATNSWRPTPTEKVGREDAYQVAAPTETRTPTMHRANIAHKKSADGRMATEAAWLNGKNSRNEESQSVP